MHRGWQHDAGRLLEGLEQHWKSRYRREELHRHLTATLLSIRRALRRDSADARLIVTTYRRILHHEAQQHELEQANQALKRFLKSLGVATVGLLPLSFVTLPALFGVAHHLGIELLPPGDTTNDDTE